MMNNITLVSIIVPCYNQAQFLPETLQSVLEQTYANWECIIVNDGSPDNTEEVALAWTKKDTRFIYMFKENGGVADARNCGIRASKGKYILPLDADYCIEQTYIQKAVKILDNSTDIGIVYCSATCFGNKTGTWKIPEHSLRRITLFCTIFCSGLYRKEDYDMTNGYNPNMVYGYEDWDLWLSMIEMGVKPYKIQENLFFYRVSENSRNSSLSYDRLIISYNQIITNHIEFYKKYYRNPFIITEYLNFRSRVPKGLSKGIVYIIKNIKIRIAFYYLYFRLNLLVKF